MKTWILICSCMLLSSVVMAGFSGSDDFNDNIRDPSKWVPFGPNPNLLNETNAHLEFASTGAGHEQDAWIWNLNTGSYTQDWHIVIDAVNLSSGSGRQAGIGIVIADSLDFGDMFMIELITTPIPYVSCLWQINGTPYFGPSQIVSTNAIKLRVAFDSATKLLSSSYDSGSGFTELTNLNVASWTMVDTDTFTAAINSWSESYVIDPGTLYVDNFWPVTMPGSAHASIHTAVEIDWLALFGVPYQVQYCTDLQSSNWVDFGSVVIGNGATNYVFDSARNGTNRFYRVQVYPLSP